MRRLLQFATLAFVLVTLLAPLCETLDRWDAPGLASDTEFAVFVLALSVTLVLLVSRLVAVLALRMSVLAELFADQAGCCVPAKSGLSFIAAVIPPLSPPPLRI